MNEGDISSLKYFKYVVQVEQAADPDPNFEH